MVALKKPSFISRHPHVSAISIYTLLSLIATFPLILNLKTHFIGPQTPSGGDVHFHIWNAWFLNYALENGLNPLWNPLHYWPIGANMLYTNHSLMISVFVYLIGPFLGFISAFNVHLLVCLILGGYAGFLLAREAGADEAPSLLAGFIAGFNPYIIFFIDSDLEYVGIWPLTFFIWRYWIALRSPSFKRILLAGFFLALTYAYSAYYTVFGLVFAAIIALLPHIKVKWIHFFPKKSFKTIVLFLFGFLGMGALLFILFYPHPTIKSGSGGIKDLLRIVAPFWLLGFSVSIFLIFLKSCFPLPAVSINRSLLDRLKVLIGTGLTWGIWLSPIILTLLALGSSGESLDPASRWRGGGSAADALVLLFPHFNSFWFRPWIEGTSLWTHWHLSATVGWSIIGLIVLGYFKKWIQPAKIWIALGITSAIFALGPFLKIAGINLYIPLPFYFLKLFPIATNITGYTRFAAVTFIFLGVAVALIATLSQKQQTFRWGPFSFLSLAWFLVLLEFAFPLPRQIIQMPEPRILSDFKNTKSNGVLWIPFSARFTYAQNPFRDERMYMIYQMTHQKAVVGGFSGRMPQTIFNLYKNDPFLSALARAQEGNGPISSSLINRKQLVSEFKTWDINWVVIEKNRTPAELVNAIKENWPVKPSLEDEQFLILERNFN